MNHAVAAAPRVTCNQALLWLVLRICGIADPIPPAGRVMTLHRP